VCRPAWVDFVPNHAVGHSAAPPAYAEYPSLSPPPLTAPAVLSYLSLAPRPSTGADALQPMSPLVPSSVSPQVRMSSEWDCEWERCKRLAGNGAPTPESPSGTFKPGTMEGVWEGLFTVSLPPCVTLVSALFPLPSRALLTFGPGWGTLHGLINYSTRNSRHTRPCCQARLHQR